MDLHAPFFQACETERKRQVAIQKGVAAVVLLTVWLTLEFVFLVLAYLQKGFPLDVVLWMEALILIPALIGLISIGLAMEKHSDAAKPYLHVCGFICIAGVVAPCALYIASKLS